MVEVSQTGDQMLSVLEIVAEHGPINAAETARLSGLNRTVAHRLLTTLAQRAYVRRSEQGYELGPAVLVLARSIDRDIASLARPWMKRLAEETGETVVLHGIDNGEAVVLDQALGRQHLVRVQHQPGSRHPLYKGASGWSILAFLDAKTQARIKRRAGNDSSIAARIEQVHIDGFAISHDELQLGVYGLAAPLLRHDGTCSASLTILVPDGRAANLRGFLPTLLTSAKAISKALP